MKTIEYIEIPYELSCNIERLFFEYNAALSVCKFLMSQPEVREDMLQKYLDSVECKWVELEVLKQKAVKEYPTHFEKADYEFDFDNHAIKYLEKE